MTILDVLRDSDTFATFADSGLPDVVLQPIPAVLIPELITLAGYSGLREVGGSQNTPEESGPEQGLPDKPREDDKTRESENNVP